MPKLAVVLKKKIEGRDGMHEFLLLMKYNDYIYLRFHNKNFRIDPNECCIEGLRLSYFC